MKTKTNTTEPPASADDSTQTTTTAPAETEDDAALAQLQAENERLKATIRFDGAHRQITGELAQMGARSPELLFDSVKSELQFADDGTLENAAAIVGKLRATFPEQFGADTPQSIDGGSGQAAAPRLTSDALHRMSAAEIAELDWNEVKRVLASS